MSHFNRWGSRQPFIDNDQKKFAHEVWQECSVPYLATISKHEDEIGRLREEHSDLLDDYDLQCQCRDGYRQERDALKLELTALKSTTDLLDRSLAHSEIKRHLMEGKLEITVAALQQITYIDQDYDTQVVGHYLLKKKCKIIAKEALESIHK